MWLTLVVGCGGAPTTFGVAPPVEGAHEGHIRFVAIGDVGKGNATQRQVAEATRLVCAREGCDLLLVLGDLLYPRGMASPDDPVAEERVLAPYADLGVPVFLLLGNHDYAHGRDTQRAGWLVDWAQAHPPLVMPGHAWHVDAGPMRLIGLDTAAAFQFGVGPQRAWLDARITETDAPWVVVAGHHPLRSDGPHGNAGTYEGWCCVPWLSGMELGRWLGSLEGRADLYLAGHDHNRQLLAEGELDLVVSGAGASTTAVVDRGNAPRFARATPGLAWFDLSPAGGEVAFFDARGVLEARVSLR